MTDQMKWAAIIAPVVALAITAFLARVDWINRERFNREEDDQ